MAYVCFYQNNRLLARRELRGPAIVGRARGSDIWVADIQVSRQHCRIEPEESDQEPGKLRWIITDLDSRNGTFIGDKAVGRHVLTEGDELKIGDTVMRFSEGAAPPSERPADPDAVIAAMRARGEAGTEQRIPESWTGPYPQPRAGPAYPGQQPPSAGDDMPTGSTVVGYRRETPGGPPPELRKTPRE